MVAHSSPLKRSWLLGSLLAASALAVPGAPPAPAIDLGGGHTLVPRLSFTDALGQTHTRLAQYYQGLRVWGSEVVSHGQGPLTASPALPMLDANTPLALPLNLDLTASVPLAAAQQAILPDFGAAPVTFGSMEMVIYPQWINVPLGLPARGGQALDATQVHPQLVGYALAYRIPVQAATGDPLTDAWDYLVDAHTGKVLTRVALNQGALPAQGTASATLAALAAPAPLAVPAGVPAVGVGNSLYSSVVDLDTTAAGSGFLLLDTTRGQGGVLGGNAVTDVGHTMPANGTPGTVYANSTNTWGTGALPLPLSATSTPAAQTIAVDAAYALQSTWDYYAQVHHRNGIDGQGTQTYIRINYGGYKNEFDNAFWNSGSYSMTVLDPSFLQPFSNLTILGHEFTHGVTNASANLTYAGESGGLNEATSDIFGVMTDTYTRLGSGGIIPSTGTNWIFPSYLYSTGKLLPLRYLYKPSKDGSSKDAWYAGIGGIDVHLSSGPMNRAFYFLSQGASANPASDYYSSYLPAGMNGVTSQEAASIWYRALTTYLTPSSNYAQARTAALRAARDLFPPDASGNPSPETLAVRGAFTAINVGTLASPDDFGTPTIAVTAVPSGTTTPSGSNLTLSATVADPLGVKEVDYFVDNVLAAAQFNPPNFTVPQFDPSHLLANGNHVLTASAFAPSGNQGTSQPVLFTANNPVQQLLLDPGFETGGLLGWQGDSSLVIRTDYSGTVAHGGYGYASFDRGAGRQNLTLSQPVTLPPGTSALLSLWTQTQGNPALGPVDSLQLQVQPQGQPVVLLDTLSNAQTPPGWVRRSYDLSAYLGQTVTLSLVSNINIGTNTAFLVDDCTLCTAAVPQVQVLVSLNPASFSPQPVTVSTFFSLPTPVGPFYAQVAGSTGSTAVTWSILEGAAGGTLSAGATPTYQPPPASGLFHVVATSVADPNVSTQAAINNQVAVTLVPAAATMETGASLPFTVVINPLFSPAFSVSGGTLTPSPGNPNQVTYTAPPVPGTYTLTAQTTSNSTLNAIATITVIAPVQVSIPQPTVNLVVGSSFTLAATVTGSANTDVIWTIQEGAAGGIISPSVDEAPPVYTAPGTAGTYHLIATSAADPSRSAVLTMTVQAGGITINPPNPVSISGGAVAFQASVTGNQTVTWSATGGSVNSLGVFTAPATPGSYLVTATTPGGALAASVTVVVKTTNFSANGKPFMNAMDLAILADAWGASTGQPGFNAACDLNGDGVVNDQDVTLFLSQFGGQ